jgi:hypothetical protein
MSRRAVGGLSSSVLVQDSSFGSKDMSSLRNSVSYEKSNGLESTSLSASIDKSKGKSKYFLVYNMVYTFSYSI